MLKVTDIITNKPYLAWEVKDPAKLSDESVLEHVLNYGDWRDVKKYIEIKGFDNTKQIFKKTLNKTRVNYSPQIKHYFERYFQVN
jgi:hypothetical protein